MEKTCNIISDSDFRSKIIDYIKSKYADADNDTSNISGAVLTLTANNVFDVYLDNHKDDLNRINNNEDIFEGMSDKQKDIMLDDIKKIIDSNFLNVPGMERRFTFGTEGRPGYTFEVSSAGDDLGKKFSALNALLGDKSIEFIYQNEVKKRGNNKNPSEDSILNIKKIAEVALYIKDNMGKTLKTEQDALDYIDKELGEVYRKYDTGEKDFKPTTYLSEKLLDILLGKDDIEELGNKFNYENISYYIGYFPLWKKWASEHKDDIEELRKAAKGKVITDKFATNSSVSQARALAFILNESLSKNTAFDVDRKYSGYYTFNPSIGNKGKVSVTVVNNGKDFYSNWGVIAKKYGLNVKDENFSEYRKPESETITESRKGAIYSLYHKLVRNGRISSTSRSFKTFEQYMKLFLDHKNIFIGGILGKTNVNFTNEKDDKGESKLIKIDAGSDLNPTVLELATAYAALNGNNVYMFDTRTKSWYKYEQGENRKIGEFKVVNDSPYFQADSLLIGDLSKRLSNKSIEKLNDFFQGAEGKKDNVVNDYIKLEEDRRKRELELKEASDDEFANEVKDKENESEKVLESLSKENVEYSELLKTMNPYQIAERVHNLVKDFGDALSNKIEEKIEELKDLIQKEKEAGHTSLALSYENILSKIEDSESPKCRKYFMKSFNYSPLKVFEDIREWYKTYLNLSTEDRLEDCKELLNLYSFSSNTQLDKKAKEVDSYRRATYPGIIANFGILMKLSAPELKVMEQMKIDVVNGNLGVEDKEDKSKEESDINSNERDIQEDSLSLASAGWMIDFREVDPYSTLSTKVRMIINSIPLHNNKGNIILDNYGRVVHANSGVVYNTLLNKMRFVTTEKEFMDMLKSMKEFTWADSLYKYLNKDKNCNERNLFYHNFRREFTTMYVMKTSTDNYGIESTELVPINETSGKGSLLGEVKDNVLSGTPSNNCKYPIYSLKEVAAKKNKPGLKVGSVNVKNVGLFHAKVLAVTSKIDRLGVSSIVENRENILTDIRDLFDRLGFNVSTDTIKSMFLDPDKAEDSYKKMKTAFNKVTEKYAERSLDTQRKKEFKYYGGVLSVYGTYALLGKLLDESVEVDLQNSAYQNGKVYQSFTNPSYLGITINALKNALNPNNEKRFNDFIKEHYTRFKWFAESAKDKDGNQILDNNGDPVAQYYCKWLGLLVKGGLANTTMENKEFFREGLDFCTIIERDGKKYTEWTDTETALSNINMFRNAKGGFGYYAVPVLADSPAAYYIRFVKYTYDQLEEDEISVYYGQKGFIKETVSGLANVMLQEYNRITTVKKRLGLKNIKKLKVFDSETGGAIFRFFPELNDFSKVEQIFGNDNFFKDIIAEEKKNGKEQASFYRIISRLAANDKDSAYEYINKAALTLMEYRYNNYINSKEAMKLKERSMAGEKTLGYKYFKNIKVAEDDQWLNEELQVYFYNHELAQTQIIELLGTDLAYYKNLNDFCKRWKEVYSSMSRLNTDAMYKYKNEEPVRVGRKYQRVVYIKTLKDISSSIPQIMNILDRKVKEGHITEEQKMDILKAYANIDVTDGQAYRCLSSYRAIKVMEGGDSWTDDMEEAYRRIKNGTWTMSDFDFTFNTFKPYTYSEYAVKSGFDSSLIKVHTQHKDSEILLTMFGSILSGDKNSGNSIQDSTLAALNDFMENGFRDNEEDQNNLGGVDLAVFDSGVKVGEQGVIDINYKNTIKEEHRKKFGLKENASYDNLLKAAGDYLVENLTGNIEKDKQLNKEIEDILKDKEYSYTYDDMLDHLYKETGIDRKTGKDITDDDNVRLGEDVVHILPFSDYGIQMATPDHSFDAEQMIGSQIVKLNTADIADNALIHVMSPNKSTNTYMNKNDYISLYHKCIVEPKIQSYLKLMKDFSNSRSISGRVVSNMYADSRYSHDMVRAASVNSKGEFIYPWYEASHTDRLQNVCNSMVKKSIIKKKMFGGSAFQATAYKSDKLKIVWKKDYGYVKEGGKYDKEDKLLAVDYIPCMMPFYSKRYFDLFKDPETGQIDISKVPQELLRAIGYRIPTEDKYSMLPLKIVGFLPKEYGSAIILPKEITTITGSDFDIDKIFLMMRRFEYNPGFNIKTYIKEQKKDKKKYLYKKASDMYEMENPELGDESYFSDTYKEAKGKVFKKYSRQSIINNYIIKHTEKNADFKDVDLKGYLRGKSVVLTDKQKITLERLTDKANRFVDNLIRRTFINISMDNLKQESPDKDKNTLRKEAEEEYRTYLVDRSNLINDYVHTNLKLVSAAYADKDSEEYKQAVESFEKLKEYRKEHNLSYKEVEESIVPIDYNEENKPIGDIDLTSLDEHQLNNMLFDLIYSNLTSPDCVSKFIDPQGFENLKKVGHIKRLITSLDFKELSECYDRIKGSAKDKLKRDTIYSQFSKIKDSAIESAVNIFTSIEDPVSPNTYVFYHNQNMRGKNMLPVYANHNVNHANVQNTNLRIKSRISFKFGDHQYPLRSLHNITDDKGRFISKTLASFIGASADTAKDPILADLYQSYSTVNMTCTLIRLGYDPAEITMLFSHPLVQSMINDMEENPFKDKRVIIYEYGAKLGLEKEDKSKVNYDVYTNDYFADSIFKYKDTDFRKIDPENTGIAPKEISELKGLCVLMDKIAQVSDDVTVITSNTRQDTTKGGIKPSLSEVRVMAVRANKINNAVDSLHSTLTNVPENEDGNRDYIPKSIFNTQILGEIGWNNKPDADKIARLREELYNSELSIPQSSYTLSIEGLNYLYGNLFLSDSPIINTIFSTLEDTFDIEKFSGKTFSKLMRHFQKYWLTQTKMFGIEDSDYTDTFRDFAFDRTMKLPESINSVQEAKRTWYIKIFPSKFKAYMDEHKDLIEKFEVLKVLYDNTNSDRFDGYSESIRFRDVGRVRKERQDFYTNELTILLHSDNKELVDLAKNLYIYGIFKYGFDFNPNGYVNLFPIDVNMNDSNYMAVLRTLEKSGNYHGMDEVYNFIDQWVCNNFTNRELSLQAPPKAVATYMNGSSDKKIITISKNNFQKDFGGIPSQFITFKVGSSYRVYRYNGDVHNLSMVNNLDYYQIKTLSNEYEYGKAILEMTNVHSKRLTEETAKELDPSFKVNDKNAATLATILDNQSKKSDEIEKQESEEDVKNPKADKETVENSSSNSRGFSLADFDVDKAIERDEARERKPEEGASLKTLVGWFGKKDDTQASMGDNSDTDINEDLNNFLLAMLKKNGVGIGSLNELDERLKLNGVTDFSATKVDGILQTIRLAKGKRGQRALPEEFAHWAMRVLLDNNDPLAIRIKNYILSHELSSEIIGNEYDNYTQEYANDNDKLAEEAAGKLLAEALNERFKEEHSPWYVRMFKIISRLLKRFKQFFGNADNKSIEEMVEELRGQNSLMAKNILRGTYNDTLSKGYKISNTRLMQIESEVKTIKQALNRVQDRELKLFNVYKKDVDNDSDNKKYLDLISNLAKNIKKGDYKKGIIDYISDGIDNLRSFNTILKTLNTNRNIKYNAKFSFLRSVRNFTDSYGKTINDLRSALRNDSSVEDDFTKSVTSIINEMGSLISEIDNMWKEQAINQCSFMLRGYFGADIITKINSLNDTKYKSVSDILRNAESDISFLDTFMDSMAASNDFILKAADQIVKKRKEEDRLESVADSKDIIAMGIKLRQAGVNNFDFLYEKDKDGKFTGNYISKYNYGKYEKDMNEFAEYIKDKYKDKSLSKDDMSKEIADWRAVHTNGFNEPADSYINDDFRRLEAEGGPKYEFYKSFMDKFEELKKILPTYAMGKISPNMAVQIRKDLLERLMASKSAKEAGAQAWQNIVDQLLVREDDTMFGELEEGEKGYVRYKMQDFDGTEFHTVPIHFNRRIKNADRDMSRDAVSTLIAFSNMAHNFRGMSNIANSMEVLKTILSERKPHEKVGKNKIYSSFTVFGKTVTSRMISEENNISKKFNNFLLSQVYGMYSTEGLSLDMPFMKNSRVSVTKLTESLSRVNSICVLGVNMLSGFASMASDITQINSEAVAGQFFNKKQLLKADSIYSKELITSLGEVGSRVKTGKLNLFIELFNVLQDHDIDAANAQFDKNKFQKFMSLNSLFFFQHLGDHWGQCRTALAMALNTKMKDKAGNETNLWDALEVEYLDKNNPELGARLKLKDGIEMQAEKLTRKQIKEGYTGKYKKVEESDLIKFSNKIRGLNDTLFGIYNKKDMSVMQRYAIGRLIIMYKKYLVTALERRFAKKDYNMDLDVMTEGYYRSMYNFTKQLIIDLRNGKMDIVRNWKNMDDTTYYNMLRGMTELSTFAVLSLALVLLGGMGKGEAKKKSWQIQLGMYLTYRLNYELSALVPSPTMLNDLVGMLKNPLAIMQTIERTSNMLKLFYPTSWIGEDSTVKQGFMKGYKKGLKILTLSPFGSVISTVYKGSHPMSFVGMYK